MRGSVFKRRNTLQMHGLHYYVRVFSDENTILRSIATGILLSS